LVARDAAVVIVNPGTSFGALREDQLHGVFTGGVTQWSQLSAFGQAIQVYVSATDADALVALGIAPGGLVATAKTLPTDAAVEAAVAGDPQGIGLVEYSDAGSAKRLDVTEIGAAPVTATADSITSGDYPYAQPVYLYTATAPQNPAVAPFASFAAGAAGQAVVKKLGFVTTLQAAPPPAPVVPTGPLTPAQKYKLLVAGATRLSTGMSFNPGSYDLDARSLRDMDRVWNMMMSDHTDPSHLILIGFADNQGTPEQNLAISKKRADAVAAIFAGRGLPPGTVVGFGSDLPVADNSTEDGREQNRRVEVYLRP
jgi:phosphate transport system substrate-binding protein